MTTKKSTPEKKEVNSEWMNIDGVMVRKVMTQQFNEKGKAKGKAERLQVYVPEDMDGAHLLLWLSKNAKTLEYTPVERPIGEFKPQKKIKLSNEYDNGPLTVFDDSSLNQ